MATVPLTHLGPWTEADLADLPEDGQRYELLEGALIVHPPPSGRHQLASFALTVALRRTCPPHLLVVEGLGVRLPEGTLLVPDVLVADRGAVLAASSGVVAAEAVRLVVEIVSPGSRTADRVTKPAAYASGAIASYWRVELDGDGPRVHVSRLDGGRYHDAAGAGSGEAVVDPPFEVDPAALRP